MKRSLILLMLFAVSLCGYSQVWNGVTTDAPVTIKKTLVSSSEDEVVVDIKVGGYYSTTVETPKGKQIIIGADDMAPALVKGAPDLPTAPVSIIIGDMAEMMVAVIESEYIDIENVEVAPSKGNISRKVNPAEVEYVYGDIYQQDAFYPAQQAELEAPYILRDFRAQNIMVYPYAYNPVTKTLRVYTHMVVAARKVGDNGRNVKTNRRKANAAIDPEIKEAYKRRFINYPSMSSRYNFLKEEGEMLVVCADAYVDALKPFVEWKNISGRPTKIVPVSKTGKLEALRNYVKDYYEENPNLAYLLLVGEYDDIPSMSGVSMTTGGRSDNYFGMLEGNDYYEEIYVGRLSVANVQDATNQVNKIIHYERDIKEDATWLTRGIGVAADEGQGHNSEIDYEHIDFIRDTLLNYTYTEVSKHYAYYNNPSAEGIKTDINKGASIINYCNHGSPTGWAVANFSIDHVHQLQNDNMLPIVWSVACENGYYTYPECFAESWMRATNTSTGKSTGAVGGMFSWISQPWIPPMYGQDEMVAILTEWRPNYKHTLGGASLNGNMYTMDACPSDYGDTHNTWLLFGDPSMMLRTDVPTSMNVSYSPSTMLIGMSSLRVNADTEFGIVTLSVDGEVLASSYVENGEAVLSFPEFTEMTKAKLVVIGYNKVTEVKEIEVFPSEGSYVLFDNYNLNDDNGQVDYGENINLTLGVKNVADETANNVKVTISTESQYVTINNAEATVSSIASNETVDISGQFSFTLAANVPDKTTIVFDVTCSDGTETWKSDFSIVAHAPVIVIKNVEVANPAGELRPGETSTFTLTFSNEGSSTAYDVMTYITSSSVDVTFANTSLKTDVANPREICQVTTEVTVSESAMAGAMYEVGCEVVSGYYHDKTVANLFAGLLKEDFETGDFATYDWTVGTYAWVIAEGGYEGKYCAASPARLQNNKASILSLDVEIFSDGVISFYSKVSSEADYDFLRFYMDNFLMGEWSGEIDWSKSEYEVEKGVHNLRWEYVKDISSSDGEDRAYLDYIVFPPMSTFEINVNEVLDNNVAIYPNPTSGVINVDVDSPFDAVVYNYQGQVMMRMYNNDRQVDMSGLMKGIYLLEIITDSERIVEKIIIK